MSKTLIGFFDTFEEAQRVVQELKARGVAEEDISIVAKDVTKTYGDTAAAATQEAVSTTDTPQGTGAKAGAIVGGSAGLVASLAGLAIPGIGPIIAAGPIVGALAGAGTGALAGGLIGGLVDIGVPELEAQYYAELVRQGGAVVTVRANEFWVVEVSEILHRYGAFDIKSRVERRREVKSSVFSTEDMHGEGTTSENHGRLRLRSLEDRVIVKTVQEERQSAGGIVIPDTAVEKPLDELVLIPTLSERNSSFLFATTRKDGTDESFFSGERSAATTYGAATVRIPERHRIGNVELPFKLTLFSLNLYEQDVDPTRHFVVEAVQVLPLASWEKLIRDSQLREVLIFVHGFNTTFRDGLYRAAQIFWDLQYRGLPVLFSWPSRGRVIDYLYDRDSALGARAAFIDFLRHIRSAGIQRVHILAHSMGNLVVLDALASHAHAAEPLGIAEIMMAAPDVDKDQYLQLASRVRAAAEGMTLYASSADRALAISKRVAGDIPRAGDVPATGPLIVEDIDTIDVTPIGEELLGLGHNSFATSRSVLNDIGLLVGQGLRPPSERLREIRGMPSGQNPPRWWRYSP